MLLLLFIHHTHAEDNPPPENLQTLISGALANNPELKASDARWQMFRAGSPRRVPLTTRC